MEVTVLVVRVPLNSVTIFGFTIFIGLAIVHVPMFNLFNILLVMMMTVVMAIVMAVVMAVVMTMMSMMSMMSVMSVMVWLFEGIGKGAAMTGMVAGRVGGMVAGRVGGRVDGRVDGMVAVRIPFEIRFDMTFVVVTVAITVFVMMVMVMVMIMVMVFSGIATIAVIVIDMIFFKVAIEPDIRNASRRNRAANATIQTGGHNIFRFQVVSKVALPLGWINAITLSSALNSGTKDCKCKFHFLNFYLNNNSNITVLYRFIYAF